MLEQSGGVPAANSQAEVRDLAADLVPGLLLAREKSSSIVCMRSASNSKSRPSAVSAPRTDAVDGSSRRFEFPGVDVRGEILEQHALRSACAVPRPSTPAEQQRRHNKREWPPNEVCTSVLTRGQVTAV